ncbi:MAG: S9 family peptidase [Acidobacteriia bacterium]|nr:S9 family peptidase [Terriglobia bacterium]
MATEVLGQMTLTSQFITDPQQVKSKPKQDLLTFSVDKLYMTRIVGGTSWSPDGKRIAFVSNISGRNNIWTVPADGGWPEQLTVSEQRQGAPAWSPDGRYIAYQSDTNGNEQWDLFLVSTANGDVTNITNTPEIAEEGPAWSPDGKTLAYVVKPKTGANFEIHLMDMLTRRPRPLTSDTPKEWSYWRPLWSKDGKRIAATLAHANGRDANVWTIDLKSGQRTNLTEHNGEQLWEVNDWSEDGKTLLVTSNAANGYENVALLDIATKKVGWITQDKWEISGGNFSPDGKVATFTANVDGNVDLYLYELATKHSQALPLPKGLNVPGGGANTEFSRDGSRILYYHNGPKAPNDVWVYDLRSKQSKQITNSLVAGVRSGDLVEPFLVHYPSTDGKWQISAFVYIPYNMPRENKLPAIVYIHGGPQSQTVNGFNRQIQFLVNQGYVVVAPNYRGGTGYGKEFLQANQMDMGGGDLADALAAVEWIKKTGYVDPKKLVAMGGSYGGYLTMMAVTKAPDLWAAGVPIVPFVNWFTEFKNEDPQLQESDRATMGDPEKNKDLWTERSPIFFIDKIKAPLLILAGGNDPRCPKEESQQIADELMKRGGVAALTIYENEGHGFSRIENQIDSNKRIAEFLKKHVPVPDCGCSLD